MRSVATVEMVPLPASYPFCATEASATLTNSTNAPMA
jgi:hypothetical protein